MYVSVVWCITVIDISCWWRLKENEERAWTNESIDSIAMKHFPNINREATLKRPILYSNWLSKDYMPVEQERLREYVQARLKVSL